MSESGKDLNWCAAEIGVLKRELANLRNLVVGDMSSRANQLSSMLEALDASRNLCAELEQERDKLRMRVAELEHQVIQYEQMLDRSASAGWRMPTPIEDAH